MATKENKNLLFQEKKQGNAVLTADDALLDEFFSQVANIAARLTKDKPGSHNDGDSVNREVPKP